MVPDSEIKKSVFISQSSDVFTNLALEDWLYKNFDFSRHHVLLLWANDPCVVIGRHQNPFTEANVSQLVERGITLARRNSGGGAVYHDLGNLNCTFFSPRERYDRKYNLNIVTRALFREWAIKAEINERDDIVVMNKKVRRSGGSYQGMMRPRLIPHIGVSLLNQQLGLCIWSLFAHSTSMPLFNYRFPALRQAGTPELVPSLHHFGQRQQIALGRISGAGAGQLY